MLFPLIDGLLIQNGRHVLIEGIIYYQSSNLKIDNMNPLHQEHYLSHFSSCGHLTGQPMTHRPIMDGYLTPNTFVNKSFIIFICLYKYLVTCFILFFYVIA